MRAPVCVGIAGGTGAGKSALAASLVQAFDAEQVLRIPQDAYYRDRGDQSAEVRAALNFDHPDALETELLVAHLVELRAGRAVDVPVYDFTRHRRAAETWRAAPRALVIVDGILALADAQLRACFDLRVFVDAPEDVRLRRRLERDVAERGRSAESVRAQFAATVRPMHARFVEPSRAHADLVVANASEFALAREALVARLRPLVG
jgi:uridine kinase